MVKYGRYVEVWTISRHLVLIGPIKTYQDTRNTYFAVPCLDRRYQDISRHASCSTTSHTSVHTSIIGHTTSIPHACRPPQAASQSFGEASTSANDDLTISKSLNAASPSESCSYFKYFTVPHASRPPQAASQSFGERVKHGDEQSNLKVVKAGRSKCTDKDFNHLKVA